MPTQEHPQAVHSQHRQGPRLTGAGYKASSIQGPFASIGFECNPSRSTGRLGADLQQLTAYHGSVSTSNTYQDATSPGSPGSFHLSRQHAARSTSVTSSPPPHGESSPGDGVHPAGRSNSLQRSQSRSRQSPGGASGHPASPVSGRNTWPSSSEQSLRSPARSFASPYLKQSSSKLHGSGPGSRPGLEDEREDSRPSTSSVPVSSPSHSPSLGRTSSRQAPPPSRQGMRLLQTYGVASSSPWAQQIIEREQHHYHHQHHQQQAHHSSPKQQQQSSIAGGQMGRSGSRSGPRDDLGPPASMSPRASREIGDSGSFGHSAMPGPLEMSTGSLHRGSSTGRVNGELSGSGRFSSSGDFAVSGRGHSGPSSGRNPTMSRESLSSYDDIPVVNEEDAEPLLGVLEVEEEGESEFAGLTLDQYMSQMVTTPASGSSTSGLGQGSWPPAPPASAQHLDTDLVGSPPAASRHYFLACSPPEHGHCVVQQLQQVQQQRGQQKGGPVLSAWRSGPKGDGGRGWEAAEELQDGSMELSISTDSLPTAAFALSNSLDLRPATAAAGPTSNSHARHHHGFLDLDQSDLIKHVDLGGLSASLFTSSNCNAAAAGAGQGDPYSRGGSRAPSGVAGGAHNPLSAPDAGRGSEGSSPGRPAPGKSWAAKVGGVQEDGERLAQAIQAAEDGGDGAMRMAAVMRQVQSARPVTRGGQELDPTVWANVIAVQLHERPPSRQKPPPEALHLWAPDQKFSVQQGRSRSMRPQTAMATTYRRPVSGIRVNTGLGAENRAGARPPTRQKPPPMSLLLEHDHEFAKPPGTRQGHRHGMPSDDSETDF